MSKQPYYLTTPIYYVNGLPHLGTAYTTMAADALARWERMDGRDVFFLTGLDEHGQKVAQTAEKNGVTPQEWCDAQAPNFTDLWRTLNISNDDFIRTTQLRHTQGVQRFWERLRDAGYLYKSTYEGWYCVHEETFHNEGDLDGDGNCPECHRPIEKLTEENWFFKLSAFEDKLLAYYDEHPDFVQPEIRRNEVVSFVKSGLRDLSVSRTTFDWGVPLPFDTNHVTYVWFDALLNYLTAVGFGDDDPSAQERFERYWPAQIHFVGKDIIRFHCVIWPAMLMAAGLPIPAKVFAHGFLLTKGEKMSKSRGNAVSPYDLIDVFGADAYRYYFLSDVEFGSDGSISLERMVQVYNTDLANTWGNLFSRVSNMASTYFGGRVPQVSADKAAEANPLRTIAEKLYEIYAPCLGGCDYAASVNAVRELTGAANHYVEDSAPWVLAKDPARSDDLAAVIYNALEACRIIALFLEPFMPITSAEVWRRLSLSDLSSVDDVHAISAWGGLPAGNAVEKGEALFPRLKLTDIQLG